MPEPPPRRNQPPAGQPPTGQPPTPAAPAPAPRSKKRVPKVQRKTWKTYLFFAAIAALVVLGATQLYGSFFGDKTPAIGDHIHAAIAVDICGTIVDNPPTFTTRAGSEESAGIHAHGDGLMHIHPEADDEVGGDATVGKFFEEGGWEISEDHIGLGPNWDGSVDVTNGGPCPDGRPATVRWMVNGSEQDGNPGDFAPDDGDRITIAFLPDGDPIPEPPDDVLNTLASALDGKSVDQKQVEQNQ